MCSTDVALNVAQHERTLHEIREICLASSSEKTRSEAAEVGGMANIILAALRHAGILLVPCVRQKVSTYSCRKARYH